MEALGQCLGPKGQDPRQEASRLCSHADRRQREQQESSESDGRHAPIRTILRTNNRERVCRNQADSKRDVSSMI